MGFWLVGKVKQTGGIEGPGNVRNQYMRKSFSNDGPIARLPDKQDVDIGILHPYIKSRLQVVKQAII
jgi:hypothetical protein